MTDAQLWASWRLWMMVAVVVVLIAASLLITVWLTARGIYAHAVRALKAAEVIRQNTLPIWELQTTNEVAARLLATVKAIEAKGGALGQAVSHAESSRSLGGRGAGSP